MKIIQNSQEKEPRVVALGMFDGVHLGHQELIRQARRLADEQGAGLRVCTFDRHPLEVLRPEEAPRLLTTCEEQAACLAALGVDEMMILPFTRETAGTEPEAFLAQLRTGCLLKAAVSGWNYTFGRGGRGTPQLLLQEGEKNGFRVLIVPPVKNGLEEIISSSAIREKLADGDLAGANEMLGRPYTISGPVVNGKHQGTRIGFPTANIQTDERKQLPAFGVYACRMSSGDASWDAVVNIGNQPTIPSGHVTVEAHALHAQVDLYGRTARVELLKRLRPERKFRSVEELKDQINKDKMEAEVFFRQ